MPRKIRMAGWVEIPGSLIRTDLNSRTSLMHRIAKDLVFRTADIREFTGSVKDERTEIPCFQKGPGKWDLKIPRYYLERISDLLVPGAATRFEDARTDGALPQPVCFRGKLEMTESKNQVAGSAALQDTYGGILAASPGKGKTVMAIHAACQMQRRTLIVVPTEHLLNQWIERIQQFTDLHLNEIGVVQGDTCQWKRPFIVGMVHSLAQREYPAELYESIGIFLTDECHRIGAPTWLQVVPRFPAKYRWGLSATPERADGMHTAFMLHIGPVVYEMQQLDSRPEVYQILTGVQLPARSMVNYWNGQLNFSRVYSTLARHFGRNLLIAREVRNCWKAGRKILVVSKRIAQLAELFQLSVKQGIPAEQMGMIYGEEKTPGDRMNLLKTRKVVFISEQIGGLGLDQPDLDTLIFGLPSQAIEQVIGRIERVDVPKKNPLVEDFVDDPPVLRKLAKSRLFKYQKRGYHVTTVNKSSATQP